MKRLRLIQSNRWQHASQLGGAIGLAFLLLLALLLWMDVNEASTILAAPASQGIGASSSVITIGATLPLTEPGSVSGGEAMTVALGIAADEINAAGGVLGVPIQLIISDTAGTPQLGVEAMDYFANEAGAVGVVGELHSSVALTMAEKAREHHIPVIFAETWSDDITTSGYTEVFRIAPVSSEINGGVPASYVAELGFDNVVIMTDDSGYGQLLASMLESALTAKGVSWQTFTATVGTTDFTSIIADIQALTPQAVMILLDGDDAFNFEQQSAQAGLAPSANTVCIDLRGNPSNSGTFWQKVPDGNYCVFRAIGPVQAHYNERTQAFATEYLSRTGKSSVESYAMEAYDSLIIMADAISRAGSTDPNAIVTAIEATNLKGAQGQYCFPYGSDNPVPSGIPAYMWHQWPDPHILMIQYFEVDQTPDDAAIVYPAIYRTHSVNLVPFGGSASESGQSPGSTCHKIYLPLILKYSS